jgi:hypothetical protein
MSEHFLNRPQVRSSLEEVGGKRVPEQVRMDAVRVETGFLGQLAKDQKGARTCQRPAAGVQEQFRPVARIEVGPAAREVTSKCLRRVPPDRDDALLIALPDHSNEAVVEIDACLLEPDRLGDSEACAVEQLDERVVAQRAWLRAGCGLDETFRLSR